ncbi:MAG: exodeoxyribonuclease VII large subunit, partial [Salinibacter sp.]
QHLDALVDRLTRAGNQIVENARARLDGLRNRLEAVDPKRPLRRGYVHLTRDGTPIDSVEALRDEDRVRLHFRDGHRDAKVLPEDT